MFKKLFKTHHFKNCSLTQKYELFLFSIMPTVLASKSTGSSVNDVVETMLS